MATDREATTATFTNPVLRFRLRMVRALQIADELERATARDDYWTAETLARQAREVLELAQGDALAAVTDLEAAQALLANALTDEDDPAHQAAMDLEAQDKDDPLTVRTPIGYVGVDPSEVHPPTESEARLAWGDR